MIIDSHQHYWKIKRGDYSWLTPDFSTLYLDFLPEDLDPLLLENDVTATVVVQAAPTVEETKFLLNLAEHHEKIKGVVGWLDMESPQFTQELIELKKKPFLVGIRPMLQDLEDDKYILRASVLENLKILAKFHVPIDLLIMPRHLTHVLRMLELVPNLKTVINHISKPQIETGVNSIWSTLIKEVSVFPNVFCKLSGLFTLEYFGTNYIQDLPPYVHHVIDVFTPSRCMFGSDWPVSLQASSYTQSLNQFHNLLPNGLTQSEYESIFSTTAINFYQLSIKERLE